MSKIVRHEFMGSGVLFWFLCVSIIGIPIAILYKINGTLRIEHDVDDPEGFVERYRSGDPARQG
jgi:hypothetical protein